MNTDTETNINEAIDWLQKVGGSVQDFAMEQAPLYCREVVAWKLWSGIVTASASVPLLALAAWLGCVAWKWHKADQARCEAARKRDGYAFASGGFVLPGLISLVATILAICALVSGVPDAVKAAVSPRLVIVEHLRGLK